MTGHLIYGIHRGNLKLFLLQYLQIAANSFMQGNLWDEWCWSVFHSAPCYLFKFLERKVKWFTREESEYRLGFTLICQQFYFFFWATICQQFKTQAWHLFGAISVPIVPLASVTLLNFWYISRSLKKTSYLEDFWLFESSAHIPTGRTCSIILHLHFESKRLVVQQDIGRLREWHVSGSFIFSP